jgi:predicted nucleic acid-binding protein
VSEIERRFLDTSVLLRVLARDDEDRARRALALLLRIERGEEEVETSSLVIFETVFTLQRRYRQTRVQIRESLDAFLAAPGLHLPEKRLFRRALGLYVSTNVSFADAFSVAAMEDRGLTMIYSWDTDFDRIPGIVRVEPELEDT